MANPFEHRAETREGNLSFLHVSELSEATENPRFITGERFEALKYALSADPQMLLARPLIVDVEKHDVVAGNMRLRAAKDLGWDVVPVFLHQFTSEAQRREWMLRDNQEYGNWVPEELSKLVASHEAEGNDLRLLGFADQELADLRKISEPDLPEMGDAGIESMPDVWGIVIDCEDEDEQQSLLEEFSERGLKCRALMV